MLLPTGPIVGGLSCGAFVETGAEFPAGPIVAVLGPPIEADGTFGDCAFRDQLSSVQESVGFAVLLVSCGLVATR
jgi:hypothetical protein